MKGLKCRESKVICAKEKNAEWGTGVGTGAANTSDTVPMDCFASRIQKTFPLHA